MIDATREAVTQTREWLQGAPRLGAQRPALAALRNELQVLIEAVDRALHKQKSPLLALPHELLLRVLSHCDAGALAQLECTTRAFHGVDFPRGFLHQAAEHAAVTQHGQQIAALMPRRQLASDRLLVLEQARHSACFFVDEAGITSRQLTVNSLCPNHAPLRRASLVRLRWQC